MPLRYLVPSTIQEATRMLAEHGDGARVIAGGTDLVVRMRDGQVRPTALVDITRIPELSVIVRRDGNLVVGATVTLSALIASSEVALLAPVVAEAAAQMGAVQLRNLATAGGNLASAVPSADLAPPLLVADAVACIASPRGDRTLPVEALFEGPHRTALRPDEVLTRVEIPIAEGEAGEAFLKFGKRRAQVLAVVNAAARVRLNGGLIEDARIALGAVAPTPIRARTAEALLRGHRPDPELLDDAGKAAAAEARPISDMRASASFRLELCRILMRRALERAVRRAERYGAGHDA